MLSFSKCINYAQLENTGLSFPARTPSSLRTPADLIARAPGNCSFVIFIASWTYLRHYQNIRMLHNVWQQKWMPTWFRSVPLISATSSPLPR